MNDLLRDLNEEQLDCVLHEAEVLQILAGPGSGKTRVLTVRIALALTQRQIPPERIVVVTFTNKAARELKERLALLVGQDLSRRLIVGTFHSVALRYLQRYGINIGLSKKITVADASDSRNVVTKVLKAIRKQGAGESRADQNENAGEKQLTASSALSHISTLKTKGVTVDLLSQSLFSKTSPLQLSQSSKEELLQVYTEYQAHLSKHNLLDFDDLIIHAIRLLKEFSRAVQTVEQVFVDEYQDTSSQQYDLMKCLAGSKRHITIVGDHDQSIYGFRAADIKNFKRMRESYPACVEFHLKQNYRSSGAIVFAASALIEQDSSRPSKNLETENGLGPQPTLRELQNAKSEADWLAKEVKRLLNSCEALFHLEDFAVLVRSASLTLPIEQALQRNQINYRLANARKFLERPHIRVLVNYLRVIHDQDTPGVLEIVNIPSRKFGQTSLENLQQSSTKYKKSLWETLKLVSRGSILLSKKRDTNMEARLRDLVKLVDQARIASIGNPSPSMAELIAKLLTGLKYEAHLRSTYPEDYSERLGDVQEFMQTSDVLAENSEDAELPDIEGVATNEISETPLDRLMAALSLMSDSGNGQEKSTPSLTISTIHSAKGLEWPVVFIPGVYHGSIPSARAMDTEQDEERRLLYVAMTRAKALLYMSYPLKSARFENVGLSSFLAHSSMTHLLADKGPKIDPHTLKELSSILRRPLPSYEVERVSEDLYSDRTDQQIADEDYDLMLINGRFLKRKKNEIPEDAQSGFSTASKVLKTMTPAEASQRSNYDKQKHSVKCVSATGPPQQQGIKAFFAPLPTVRRHVTLPVPSTTSQFAPTVSTPTDDYRTVILSSSPERGTQFDDLLSLSTSVPANEPPNEPPTMNLHQSQKVYTVSQPLQSATINHSALPKTGKKRLGMSRPRLMKPHNSNP